MDLNGKRNDLNNIDLMDENDRLNITISGYGKPIHLPSVIHETIRQYSWNNFNSNSIQRITNTYHFASVICKYINSKLNICPFSSNKDFNLLHLYICLWWCITRYIQVQLHQH